MTNEEAVKMLRTMQRTVYLGNRKFEDAIECAIKALSEPLQPWEVLAAQSVLSQPEPHWILVTERLPEENYLDDGYVEPSQYVLVYMSYHCYKVSRYWGHRKTKGTSGYVIPDWMDLEDHDGDNVLAWCELPEPYKEVTE